MEVQFLLVTRLLILKIDSSIVSFDGHNEMKFKLTNVLETSLVGIKFHFVHKLLQRPSLDP